METIIIDVNPKDIFFKKISKNLIRSLIGITLTFPLAYAFFKLTNYDRLMLRYSLPTYVVYLVFWFICYFCVRMLLTCFFSSSSFSAFMLIFVYFFGFAVIGFVLIYSALAIDELLNFYYKYHDTFDSVSFSNLLSTFPLNRYYQTYIDVFILCIYPVVDIINFLIFIILATKRIIMRFS